MVLTAVRRNVVETASRPDALVPFPCLIGRPTRIAELLQGRSVHPAYLERRLLLGIEDQAQANALPADRLVDMNRQRVLPGVCQRSPLLGHVKSSHAGIEPQLAED